jgi:hypothetical protein
MSWEQVEALVPLVVSIERLTSLSELARNLGEQCLGIRMSVIPQWRKEPDSKAAFKSIAVGLAECTRPWVLYLEDDVELSQDFGAKLLKRLPLVPGVGALSFFSPAARDIDFYRAGRFTYEAPRPFVWAQCLLLRRELAHAWAESLFNWDGHPTSIDNALTPAADKLGLSVCVALPSLAQHRSLDSTWGHANQGIKSRTFNAWL